MVGSRVEQLLFAVNLQVEVGGLACREKARGMDGDRCPLSKRPEGDAVKALPKIVMNTTPSTPNSCRPNARPPTSR